MDRRQFIAGASAAATGLIVAGTESVAKTADVPIRDFYPFRLVSRTGSDRLCCLVYSASIRDLRALGPFRDYRDFLELVGKLPGPAVGFVRAQWTVQENFYDREVTVSILDQINPFIA